MKSSHFLPIVFLFIAAGPLLGNAKNLSLSNYQSQIAIDTTALNALLDTIKGFVSQKEYDSVISHSKKLLNMSQKVGDSSFMITSNHYLGYYLQAQLKSAEAYSFYNNAYKLNVRMGNKEGAAEMLNAMANIQKGLGDYIGSQITAVEGLEYVKGTTDYKMESALYYIISVSAKELGDYEDALLWNDRAINMAQAHPKEVSKATLMVYRNTRANILVKYEKYTEAIALYTLLLNENSDPKNDKEKTRILDNLTFAKWLSGDRDPALETMLLNYLASRQENNDVSGLIASYIHLTQFYSKTNKEQALQYAEKAYTATLERQNPIASMEALDYIIQLKSELKENATSEALAYSEIRNRLEGTNQKIRRIYATTKYDNEQLTKDVLVLRAATAEKQKQNILYLSGSVIVLMGSIFLFLALRNRHKREKIQEGYKTEKRISKKIHDELANDVYQVMTQLEISHTNTQLLDAVEHIYHRTRDISRENNSIHTDHRYAKELTSMLGNYTPLQTKIYIQGLEDMAWQKMTSEKKVTLYRVLQELMTNMKKHSEATLVAISFKKIDNSLLISYTDNGKGASLNDKKHGNGLENVENRISAIEGSFTFTTEIGSGFKAEIKLPN